MNMTIFIVLTQSLIVAYRCKLELWDDDKVENQVIIVAIRAFF